MAGIGIIPHIPPPKSLNQCRFPNIIASVLHIIHVDVHHQAETARVHKAPTAVCFTVQEVRGQAVVTVMMRV